jgi:hypothetical protein
MIGALVQVLGAERVPHLAAVHEQYKVQGRQYMETLRAGIASSDSYTHYPAYLSWLAARLEAIEQELMSMWPEARQ